MLTPPEVALWVAHPTIFKIIECMAKLPPTTIFISRLELIPEWFLKYLDTHLQIHRPSWKIKKAVGTAIRVNIHTEMATKKWMEDMKSYFDAWVKWAKASAKKTAKVPTMRLPSERPPGTSRPNK